MEEQAQTDERSLTGRMDDYLIGMQALYEQERNRYQEHIEQAEKHKETMRRLEAAMRALSPETAKPKIKRQQVMRTRVSEATRARVLQCFEDQPNESLTRAQILEASGLSHDAVMRAINLLREQDVVRRDGKRGVAHTFRLMPERLRELQAQGADVTLRPEEILA